LAECAAQRIAAFQLCCCTSQNSGVPPNTHRKFMLYI
jgi:hypothetical protein